MDRGKGESMTKRDEDILKFIKKYMKANGTIPTMREIAKCVGISIKTVHRHFQKLVKEGYIEQTSRYGYKVKGMNYVEELRDV